MITEALNWLHSHMIQPEKNVAAPGSYVILRTGNGGETVHNLDPLAHAPMRRRAQVSCETLESFESYVKTHIEKDTAIFFDHSGAMAVFDYISGTGADKQARPTSRYDHRAVMPLQRTTVFQHWSRAAGNKFSQQAFAEFLDGRLEIVKPSAADLMENVESLEATADFKFTSKFDRQSGFKVFHVSTEKKSESVKIPDSLTVRCQVFTCSPTTVDIEFLLRYRVPRTENEGGLTFFYECPALDEIVERETEAVYTALQQRFPNASVLRGTFNPPRTGE